MNVPIVIVGVAAIVLLVPDSKNPRPGRLDPFGVLLSIVALVVLVNGVIQGGNSNEWLRGTPSVRSFSASRSARAAPRSSA